MNNEHCLSLESIARDAGSHAIGEDDRALSPSTADASRTASPRIRLRALTGEVEAFLVQQVCRFEALLGECGSAQASEPALAEMRSSLDQQRRLIDDQRQRQQQQVQEETARLAEAWRRMESEQRRLLAQRQALSQAVTTSQTLTAGTAPASAERRNGPPGALERECVPDEEALSAESAVYQFQQLRREIQRHTRKYP